MCVTAGVYARYVYNNHWYVASGLLVSYAHAPLQVKAPEEVVPESYYTCHYDRGAVSLPIHAGYRILFTHWEDRAVSFFTGTSLSCGFAGQLKTDVLPGHTMYGSNGLMRRFDASWDVGATFELGDLLPVKNANNALHYTLHYQFDVSVGVDAVGGGYACRKVGHPEHICFVVIYAQRFGCGLYGLLDVAEARALVLLLAAVGMHQHHLDLIFRP